MESLSGAKQILVPNQSRIPFDELCAVIQVCDFETLQSSVLVSHDISHEAGKLLWRSCAIDTSIATAHAGAYFKAGCSFVMREDRAASIRSLRIDTKSLQGDDVDLVVHEVLGNTSLHHPCR